MIIRSVVGVLHLADFGELATPDFSVYRDVLVLWDADHDARILAVLDELLRQHQAGAALVAAAEHKGLLTLWWWGESTWQGAEVATADADTWRVVHRKVRPDDGTCRLAVRP
jgi:hypothetical protein